MRTGLPSGLHTREQRPHRNPRNPLAKVLSIDWGDSGSCFAKLNDFLQEQATSNTTLEPGKRAGRPCIRSLRITVYDVLFMFSSGISQQEVLDDFSELPSAECRRTAL